MTEDGGEKGKFKESWIERTYKRWLTNKNLSGPNLKESALEQTLYGRSLMENEDWNKDVTPGEIADFILKTVPEEADRWIHKRNENPTRFLEQNRHDEGFRRVCSVKSELVSRMRETADLHQS
ncbi:MAG: hypothetical protein NTZ07_02685 [Candidatus Woesebacteria bacterium]|nr:hypothetical protein [Candidatus Woesebacteria bacterium]